VGFAPDSHSGGVEAPIEPRATLVGAPDAQNRAGSIPFDTAWKAVAKSGNPLVRIVLDDPSFPTALGANLGEHRDGTFSLLWNRLR
jgi:uncharacterized protein (DUF736 family)